MDLTYYRVFVKESKLIFWHKIFFSVIEFDAFSRSFSKSLDKLGWNDIGHIDETSSGKKTNHSLNNS